MKTGKKKPAKMRWTASQLRKLPAKRRDAILKKAAALAAREYRNYSDLIV